MKDIRKVLIYFIIITALAGCQNKNDNQTESDLSDPHPNMSHLENEAYATPGHPVISPSGNYIMVIESGFNDNVYDNHFVIYSSENNEEAVFICETNYRTRDRLYFKWDESDNIHVYSGDIGTTLWKHHDGSWVKSTASASE